MNATRNHLKRSPDRGRDAVQDPVRSSATCRPPGMASAAIGIIDVLQIMGRAGFLIDLSGRIVHHNLKAASLLGDGLEISRGELRATHRLNNAELEALIGSCQGGDQSRDWTAIALVHRRSKRPLLVRALAMESSGVPSLGRGAVLLLITDPDELASPTPSTTLARLFGLTDSEATLVQHLEQELQLSKAAHRMSISVETARTHLKRILTKTHTHRQQELLMLLRRLAP